MQLLLLENIRRNFGKLESLSIPNLIEVQKFYKELTEFKGDIEKHLIKVFIEF